MADNLVRNILMLQQIPQYPRKITTAEIERRLNGEGHKISRRTIQRDLDNLSRKFPIACDDRSKPYGWSVIGSMKKIPGSA